MLWDASPTSMSEKSSGSRYSHLDQRQGWSGPGRNEIIVRGTHSSEAQKTERLGFPQSLSLPTLASRELPRHQHSIPLIWTQSHPAFHDQLIELCTLSLPRGRMCLWVHHKHARTREWWANGTKSAPGWISWNILDYINSPHNVKTIELAITFTEEFAKVGTTITESKSICQRITTINWEQKREKKTQSGSQPKATGAMYVSWRKNLNTGIFWGTVLSSWESVPLLSQVLSPWRAGERRGSRG